MLDIIKTALTHIRKVESLDTQVIKLSGGTLLPLWAETLYKTGKL